MYKFNDARWKKPATNTIVEVLNFKIAESTGF
jgi:hypothetical protein